jgi:hypothetical protein
MSLFPTPKKSRPPLASIHEEGGPDDFEALRARLSQLHPHDLRHLLNLNSYMGKTDFDLVKAALQSNDDEHFYHLILFQYRLYAHPSHDIASFHQNREAAFKGMMVAYTAMYRHFGNVILLHLQAIQSHSHVQHSMANPAADTISQWDAFLSNESRALFKIPMATQSDVFQKKLSLTLHHISEYKTILLQIVSQMPK